MAFPYDGNDTRVACITSAGLAAGQNCVTGDRPMRHDVLKRCLAAWLLSGLAAATSPPVAAAEPKRAGEAAVEPLKVVMAVGPNKEALARFRDFLKALYYVEVTLIEAGSGKEIPGIEALQTCDVFLSNLRRTKATPEQLAIIKKYVADAKPVVGLRRAHHGFQNWLEADREVFGVKYGGHGGWGKDGKLVIPDDQKDNPLIAGLKPFLPGGGLYDHSQLDPKATVLMRSVVGEKTYPQMWTLVRPNGQRVFYARFDPSDILKDEGVRNVVIRALFWAAQRHADKFRKKR
jgi:type 1 glutamine amidotransferase